GAVVKFADATAIVVERDGDLEAPASQSEHITLTSLEDDARGGDTNLDGQGSAPVAGVWNGIPVQGSGRVNLTNFVDIRYVCAGACKPDGAVAINELLTSVNLALGNTGASCTAGDANQDGQVTVNELVAAVNHALNGCSPSATGR